MFLYAALKLRCINMCIISRTFCSLGHKINAEKLVQRTLLRISGPDTPNFLQSMITNDVKNIEEKDCIYSLLLNLHGRVLYDTIFYKIKNDVILVEYDATAKDYLYKHLLIYRLRKNVKMEPLDSMSSWVIFNFLDDSQNSCSENLKQRVSNMKDKDGFITSALDPRLPELGIRIITKKDVNASNFFPDSDFHVVENGSYRQLRYKLGVGEGVVDHPPGTCFPFETNVDLLNGISFHKGCYLGQELTARVHYTGVIRKRLMPVTLTQCESYPTFPPDCPVLSNKEQKMGKFRSHFGQYGLAVLNHEDCLKVESLHLKNFDVKLAVHKPNWWPDDMTNKMA